MTGLVRSWVKALGLTEEVATNLIAHGYDTLERVSQMTTDQLAERGITVDFGRDVQALEPAPRFASPDSPISAIRDSPSSLATPPGLVRQQASLPHKDRQRRAAASLSLMASTAVKRATCARTRPTMDSQRVAASEAKPNWARPFVSWAKRPVCSQLILSCLSWLLSQRPRRQTGHRDCGRSTKSIIGATSRSAITWPPWHPRSLRHYRAASANSRLMPRRLMRSAG